MIQITSHQKSARVIRPSRAGFTLVEMLVAVGLLILLMSILAQMFALASSAMSSTRGIANNDQKSRILNTVLKSDLSRMSYKVFDGETGIQTFLPDNNYQIASNTTQEGYVYISENNPADDTDDVLAFTAKIKSSTGSDVTPFYGPATAMSGASSTDINQPEWDDGVYANGSMQSKYAEIVYFLRKGTLYRQVFLVRKLDDSETDTNNDNNAQPTKSDMLNTPLNFVASTYYQSYSLSSFHDENHSKPRLHGTLGHGTHHPLAQPHLRTGFYHKDGQPMEYRGDGNKDFFGRFTMNELSSTNFNYPVTHGIKRDDLVKGHTDALFTSEGKLSNYGSSTNPRNGADVLMTNVLSFDVKLWDYDANTFVNIGDTDSSAAAVTLHRNNNKNQALSDNPTSNFRNIYDTWYDPNNVEYTGNAGSGEAPYCEKNRKLSYSGSLNWQPYKSYSVGEKVFNTSVGDDKGAYVYFECVQAGTSSTSGSSQPPNQYTKNLLTDGTVKWKAVINEKPLKGIRISIRFLDQQTGQTRQLAINHSFTEN